MFELGTVSYYFLWEYHFVFCDFPKKNIECGHIYLWNLKYMYTHLDLILHLYS